MDSYFSYLFIHIFSLESVQRSHITVIPEMFLADKKHGALPSRTQAGPETCTFQYDLTPNDDAEATFRWVHDVRNWMGGVAQNGWILLGKIP